MRLLHVITELLQRGVRMTLEVITDGGFDALAEGTSGVGIKGKLLLKPQARNCTDKG